MILYSISSITNKHNAVWESTSSTLSLVERMKSVCACNCKNLILKAKIQIISLHNAPTMCYIHMESNFGFSVLSMDYRVSMLSLGNRVVLKNIGRRCDSLGNNQTKWIIMKDLEDEWFYLKESKSGQYLKATNKQTLTTDGIYLVFKVLLGQIYLHNSNNPTH